MPAGSKGVTTATKADILDRKQTHFVLWRPVTFATPPKLVLGELTPGNPPKLIDVRHVPMTIVEGVMSFAIACCPGATGRCEQKLDAD